MLKILHWYGLHGYEVPVSASAGLSTQPPKANDEKDDEDNYGKTCPHGWEMELNEVRAI